MGLSPAKSPSGILWSGSNSKKQLTLWIANRSHGIRFEPKVFVEYVFTLFSRKVRPTNMYKIKNVSQKTLPKWRMFLHAKSKISLLKMGPKDKATKTPRSRVFSTLQAQLERAAVTLYERERTTCHWAVVFNAKDRVTLNDVLINSFYLGLVYE